jgi:hypothetical protein
MGSIDSYYVTGDLTQPLSGLYCEFSETIDEAFVQAFKEIEAGSHGWDPVGIWRVEPGYWEKERTSYTTYEEIITQGATLVGIAYYNLKFDLREASPQFRLLTELCNKYQDQVIFRNMGHWEPTCQQYTAFKRMDDELLVIAKELGKHLTEAIAKQFEKYLTELKEE